MAAALLAVLGLALLGAESGSGAGSAISTSISTDGSKTHLTCTLNGSDTEIVGHRWVKGDKVLKEDALPGLKTQYECVGHRGKWGPVPLRLPPGGRGQGQRERERTPQSEGREEVRARHRGRGCRAGLQVGVLPPHHRVGVVQGGRHRAPGPHQQLAGQGLRGVHGDQDGAAHPEPGPGGRPRPVRLQRQQHGGHRPRRRDPARPQPAGRPVALPGHRGRGARAGHRHLHLREAAEAGRGPGRRGHRLGASEEQRAPRERQGQERPPAERQLSAPRDESAQGPSAAGGAPRPPLARVPALSSRRKPGRREQTTLWIPVAFPLLLRRLS